jgi:hypothetical protein
MGSQKAKQKELRSVNRHAPVAPKPKQLPSFLQRNQHPSRGPGLYLPFAVLPSSLALVNPEVEDI